MGVQIHADRPRHATESRHSPTEVDMCHTYSLSGLVRQRLTEADRGPTEVRQLSTDRVPTVRQVVNRQSPDRARQSSGLISTGTMHVLCQAVSSRQSTDRQTDRPTDRQTNRPTDQQTDRLRPQKTDRLTLVLSLYTDQHLVNLTHSVQ